VPDADLRVGHSHRLPFGDDAFDVVTAGAAAPLVSVLDELLRVVRPGGRVAVGGHVPPAGGWAREFGTRLGWLVGTAEEAGDPNPLGELRAAGLTVCAAGEVGCPAVYPSPEAAWSAMLTSEPVLAAIRDAGERPVRDAFRASVAGAVEHDGSVRLSGAFRFAVGSLPYTECYRK